MQQLDLSGLPDKKKVTLDLSGLPQQKSAAVAVPTTKPDAPALPTSRPSRDIDISKLRQLDFSGVKPREVTYDEFLTDAEPNILDRLVTGGIRIGGSTVGAIVGVPVGGAAGTAVPVVGNAAGVVAGGIAGGAAGAAGGDWLAQRYEMARGLRRKYSSGQTLTEAVLGAIPGGKFVKGASVLRQAAKEGVKGAAMSAGGTIAQSELEGRGMPAFKDVATSAALGFGIGGAIGAGAQKFKNRPGVRAPKPGAIPEALDDLPLTPVASHAASEAPISTPITPMKPVASHGPAAAVPEALADIPVKAPVESGAQNLGVKPGTQAIKAEAPAVKSEPFESVAYRGSSPGRDELPGKFYSPDKALAEKYGSDVVEKTLRFEKPLRSDNWIKAKAALGLPKSATMADLLTAAKERGYDGIVFGKHNGRPEFVELSPASVKSKAAEELSDAEMVALEREPVEGAPAPKSSAMSREEPLVSSRTLPNEEDVDMAEFGTLGRPQEIPPADAPVPKRFLDNPRKVREQVRRIVAELDAMQFEKGGELTGDDLDANFAESGYTDRPGSREAFEANPMFPGLRRMNPNAPIYHELKNSRQRVNSKGEQVGKAGGLRTGRQIQNAGMRYIDGKGNPTPITEDIVRLARKIARGESGFRKWMLPEDAGMVAEDFASSRPDVEATRVYDGDELAADASLIRSVGEDPTPNVNAELPGSPVAGRSGGGGGGKPPGGGDSGGADSPDWTGPEGQGPVTSTAPGRMGDEQKFDGIQLKGFDKSVRPALKGMLEATDGFEAHRRGVQSFDEHTKVLADQIEVDIKNSLPRGRALNAEETVAYANRLAEASQRVTSLASKVRDGSATVQETLQLAAATQEQYVLQKSLWGSVTETGRALNAWRLMMGILETGDTKFMKWAIKQGVGDDMEKLAEKLAEIGDDPVARFKWLKSEVNAKMSKMDMLKAYYYGNLLSGLATHERNFLSNSANLMFSIGSDVATGKAGHAAASLKGVTQALFSRAPKGAGQALAMPKAIQTFVDELLYGFNPANLEGNGVMAGGRVQQELPGGALNPWNNVRRLLDGADGFFRTLTREGEKYRMAYDIAKNSPAENFERVMTDAYNNLPADKLREIEEVVSRGVFQEQPGKIGQAMMGLQKVPGAWMFMPFVRIASNLTRQGIEVTPAGFFMKSAQVKGRAGELARARAAAGSLALLPIVVYAAAGKITGNGPSDPGERASWMASGRKPNSIWNPATNEWVSYQSWQPVAFPMSVVANAFDSFHDVKRKIDKRSTPDDDVLTKWSEIAGQTVLRTSGSVLNQSFLSGLNDLLEAMSQPERSANKVATNLVTGFMPLSGASRTAAQVFDRTQRAPEGPVEAVKGIVPGLSKTIEPLVDRFGEPVQANGSPLIRGFYQASPARDEALSRVLDRAGVFPQRPNARLQGVDGKPIKLTRPEETVLMMARGRARRLAYESVVGNKDFAGLAPEQQAAALEQVAQQRVGAITGKARGLKATGQQLTLEKLLGTK